MIQDWSIILFSSFQAMWQGIIEFLPRMLLALIVFVLGWVIADILGKFVAQIVDLLKIDKVLSKTGIEEPLKRANIRLNSAAFVGGLIRWFFLIVFLLATFEILGLSQLSVFLKDVVLQYLPHVIAAVFIMLIAAVLADVLQKVVIASAKAAHLTSSVFLGGVTKWAIWIFAILAALYELGIAGALIQTLFTAFVAMIAVAGGLAFGLGGKDAAARFIEKLRQDISERQ